MGAIKKLKKIAKKLKKVLTMGLLCDIISKLSARQRDTNENVKKKFQKVEKFLLTMSFESAIMCFHP